MMNYAEKSSYSASAECGDSKKEIREIIQERRVLSHFQPIVSVKSRRVFGFEALARGIQNGIHPVLVPPNILFAAATELGMNLELDRLCRERGLDGFFQMKKVYPDLDAFLFLNLDSAIMDKGVVGSGHLINAVLQKELLPKDIVIEICESRIQNTDELCGFVQRYKEYGFSIALDDIGVGFSNLDRILLVKPDILKIDRCLVRDIDQDCYKQEVFAAIVNLSKKIGALIVAEGIETEQEAIVSCRLGADLLQGYYFSRPQPLAKLDVQMLKSKLDTVSSAFRMSKISEIISFHKKVTVYESIMNKIIRQLSRIGPAAFEGILQKFIQNPQMEYLYVLDRDGIQVSDSIFDMETPPGQQKAFFHAARKGADQSLKDYYLCIHAGMAQYVTDPYISYASGNLCITIANSFVAADRRQYILCADFAASY